MSGHRKWSEIRAGAAKQHELPRTLGDLRRECGLSQQDVADELGLSQANISKLEHQADPQVSTLMRYLGALGASIELRAAFPDRSVSLYFIADDVEAEENVATNARVQRHVSRIAQ